MGTLRAVVFDLDGTLLDRRATFRRHLELLIERHPDLFSDVEPSETLARLLDFDRNGFEDRFVYYGQVARLLGLPDGSADRLRGYFERYFPEECFPMSNMTNALDGLRERGLRLGLITNGRVLIQERKLRGLGIQDRFDSVLISEAVGVRKPDPRIFLESLSELGVSPHEAAYVGDNPEPDVVGAKQSGMLAVWRRDEFFDEPDGADLVIDDLSELLTTFGARDRPSE